MKRLVPREKQTTVLILAVIKAFIGGYKEKGQNNGRQLYNNYKSYMENTITMNGKNINTITELKENLALRA